MPGVTAIDTTLSTQFDGAEVACQLLEPSIRRPQPAEGTTVTDACGGDHLIPGAGTTAGEITATVLADYTETTGITWLCDNHLGKEIPVVYAETLSNGRVRTWTGTGVIQAINRPWTINQTGRHDLTVRLVTEDSPPVYSDLAP